MTAKRRRKAVRRRELTHVVGGSRGPESRMVDVGKKPVTARSALARASVRFPPGLLERVPGLLEHVLGVGGPKGPVTEVARAAGVLAAKRTGELIPMCHPLGLDHVEIRFEPDPEHGSARLEVLCRAANRGRTGVEMEALVGAAIAALTVYDMVKGLDHGITIERLELLEKRGGRSGVWRKADGNDGHGR